MLTQTINFLIVLFLNIHLHALIEGSKSKINSLDQAIKKSRTLIENKKRTLEAPCVSIAVSINGKQVWGQGFGTADLENGVPCTSKSVFRIGDVATALSMVAIAKQWEKGNLDLDASVMKYLPNYTAIYNNQKVTISTRQLVTHTSGIRHYNKPQSTIKNDYDDKINDDDDECANKEPILEDDTSSPEMMSLDRYGDAKSALVIFQDDPLIAEPGSQLLYSTYGWTLASAVLESVTNTNITGILSELFKQFNMDNTFLDQFDPIIYNRGGLYTTNMENNVKNSPYVDNSHKWAESGVLSSVEDLIQFGTSMLYCKQQPIETSSDEVSLRDRKSYETSIPTQHKYVSGYLLRLTMNSIWTPSNFALPDGSRYGMGWYIYLENSNCGQQEYYVARSRVTIGASSVIVVLPSKNYSQNISPPQGIVVAISANLQGYPLQKTAMQIAQIFEEC